MTGIADLLDEVDRIETQAEPTAADLARLDAIADDADSFVASMAKMARSAIGLRTRAAGGSAALRPQGSAEEGQPAAAEVRSDPGLGAPYTGTEAERDMPPGAPLHLAAGEGAEEASPDAAPAGNPLPGTPENSITSLSTFVDKDDTDMPTGSFVAYYRVSTAKQGASGLGLDAQREAVKGYLNGGDWRIVGEFVEVESGRNSDRPELAKALTCARLHRAALVVANVSRLTRSSGFLHKLLDAGVDVRFADLPQIEGPTGRFMLQQMAAVAELEAGMIGDRTRKALAAAKARGTKLGGSRGVVITAEQRAQGRAAQTARSTARAADVRPIIAELQAGGATSLGQIAAALTERRIPTARGAERWSPMQVSRVLKAASHGA